MKLPFMQQDKWPTSKEPGEKVVNPSYDTKIEEHLMDDLLSSMKSKDVEKLRETIVALVQHIKSQEKSDEM